MSPLVEQLALSFDDSPLGSSKEFDLPGVEAVPARDGLVEQPGKVALDALQGIRLCAEALKLRMVPVAACPPSEDFACEQAFAPRRNETGRIQILRMNGPEAHGLGEHSPAGLDVFAARRP